MDIIDFDAALVGQTISLTMGSLEVSDSLRIINESTDPVTLDAGGLSSVVIVGDGSGIVHLTGLALVNGNSEMNGGGLFVSPGQMVTLTDVTILNSSAPDGGGIYNDGGVVVINGGSIDSNVATGESGSGGGIFNGPGGRLELANTTLTGNRANRAGGGIEDNSGVGLGVVLVNVTLSDNNAGVEPASPAPGNGGGLHITGPGDIEIVGGTVMGNVAAREGGGLWNGSGLMTVEGTSVSANVASGAGADDGGGGIFNNGGTLVLDSVTLVGNTADGAAGSGGGLLSTTGTVTISGGSISGNVANRAGGGIEIIDGELAMNEVALGGGEMADGNIAGPEGTASPGNGGGLHVTGVATVVIDGGAVMNNVAAREGGGLWNQAGTTMTVRNGADISSNVGHGSEAHDGGGGIFNNGGTLIVESSAISGNIADGASGSGGGILSTAGSVTIMSATIGGNIANRAGGGIEIVDGILSMSDVSMSGNNAGLEPAVASPGNGGGLHVSGTATVDIVGGDVSANIAASEGGGLWNQIGTTMTVSERSVISGNRAAGAGADNGGGGVFNNGGTLVLDSVMLVGNIADGVAGSGGGLLSTAGMVTINGGSIVGNVANRAGGGMEIIDGELTMQDVALGGMEMVDGNIAGPEGTVSPGNGGGLHVTGVATVLIDGGTVMNNVAAREGGGLWNQVGTTMTVRNGTVVSDNLAHGPEAHDGGGGIFNNGGDVVIDSVEIAGNIADGSSASGGGILSTAGTIMISGGMISGNRANRAGGGIEIIDGTLISSDLAMTGNNVGLEPAVAAPGNGGALHVSGIATIEIDGGVVSENVAAREGGGLWNQAGSTMTVRNGTVVSLNRSPGAGADDGGGGIFNNGGTLVLDSVTLVGNTADGASGSGGGLFSTAGMVTINGGSISGNVANRAGGGIEIIDGGLTMNGVALGGAEPDDANVAGPEGTAAPGNGGGLHVTGVATVVIDGGTVMNNVAAREGGGLWNQAGTTMTVRNGTVIADNSANGPEDHDGGGGIFNNGGDLVIDGTGSGVTINANRASGENARGGGILSIGGSISSSGATIAQNITREDVSADDYPLSGPGLVQVDGAAALSDTAIEGDVVMASSAVLSGGPSITGSLLLQDSAVLSPGIEGTGTLAGTDVRFSPDSRFELELGGTTPGSGHDQLQALGQVSLWGTTLDVSLVEGFIPGEDDAFTIIDNRGGRAVGGMFDGQPEGSYMWIGVTTFRLSYRDGDGNDVVLRPVGIPGIVNIAINEAPYFNEESGFVEQSITLNNNSELLQAGIVVFVSDLPSGVTLANATGVSSLGNPPVETPFILIDEKLPSAEGLVVNFQFESDGDSVAFSPTYSLISTPDDGVDQSITVILRLVDGSFLLQFESLDGEPHDIEYSADLRTWPMSSTVVGEEGLTAWIDNGPPATDVHPDEVGMRFYRVRSDVDEQ